MSEVHQTPQSSVVCASLPPALPVPEGDHFTFDDDGRTLGLSIFGKTRMAIVICAGLLPSGLLPIGLSLFAFAGVPGVRWLLMLLGTLFLTAFLHIAFGTWLGHERIEFRENDIRIRRYTTFPTRRVLPLHECRGIGIFSPPADEIVFYIGQSKGRIGLVFNDGVFRFGCVFNDEEAESVIAFILTKRPYLRRYRFEKDGLKWTATPQES